MLWRVPHHTLIWISYVRPSLICCRYIIHQLTNQVFTAHTEFLRVQATGASTEPLSRFLVCVVSLLAQIATTLNDPEVSDTIVPMLISRTCTTDELLALDEQLMKRLTDIALLQHSESHARVSELFTNVYRRMPPAVPINAILPKELERLAKGTQNAELAEALWLRLVRLFQQLATQLLRSKVTHPTAARACVCACVWSNASPLRTRPMRTRCRRWRCSYRPSRT